MMKGRTTIQVSEDLRKSLRVLAAKRDVSYQELLRDMISVFSELDKDQTIISIPKKLSKKLKEIVKESDFKSLSDYTAFILRLMIYENLNNEEVDEKIIKDRLKSLGYL